MSLFPLVLFVSQPWPMGHKLHAAPVYCCQIVRCFTHQRMPTVVHMTPVRYSGITRPRYTSLRTFDRFSAECPQGSASFLRVTVRTSRPDEHLVVQRHCAVMQANQVKRTVVNKHK